MDNTHTNVDKKQNKAPTSIDVARLAGVSQSSVSRVFNKHWDSAVRDDIRKKVLKAAKTLNYRPNALARSLNVSKSSIIGVVVSEQFNDFYHNLLNIITNLLQRQDMRVMVINCRAGQSLDQVVDTLREYQVDGIIITGAVLPNVISTSGVNSGCPVVLLNIHSPDIPCSSVYCDNFSGAFKMAEYLYGTGCRRFVYVSPGASPTMNHEQRQQGFLAGLESCGKHACEIAVGDYTYESGRAAARQILAAGAPPDAFFCASELMAFGVMDVAREEFGLCIPQDLSVAGYDDSIASSLSAYNLTGIRQPLEQLAKDTVDVMGRLILQPELKHECICEPLDIVFRSSTH